jgi:hypothetical protein
LLRRFKNNFGEAAEASKGSANLGFDFQLLGYTQEIAKEAGFCCALTGQSRITR